MNKKRTVMIAVALGLTLAQFPISAIADEVISVPESAITIIKSDNTKLPYPSEGGDYHLAESIITNQELGRKFDLSALRKRYSYLPKAVKNYLKQYGGINTYFAKLDSKSTTLNQALYEAGLETGMPDWIAYIVAKFYVKQIDKLPLNVLLP